MGVRSGRDRPGHLGARRRHRGQARFAFDGVKQALEAAGSSMDNILELLTYHTDMARDGEIFGRVKDEYIKEPYPCWTGIGVTHLARPELLCEVRVVAYAND
ncbi:Rid family hydrolase [Rhodococcus sp. WB9]|uniref:Rid family hydrolase n=1 Tax=Rhodococcus sp. WB9 TaxID=2594007 RepID=UPI0021B4CC90|nr:Rid family hydrolase [Rhodococcus sp. WB9]